MPPAGMPSGVGSPEAPGVGPYAALYAEDTLRRWRGLRSIRQVRKRLSDKSQTASFPFELFTNMRSAGSRKSRRTASPPRELRVCEYARTDASALRFRGIRGPCPAVLCARGDGGAVFPGRNAIRSDRSRDAAVVRGQSSRAVNSSIQPGRSRSAWRIWKSVFALLSEMNSMETVKMFCSSSE